MIDDSVGDNNNMWIFITTLGIIKTIIGIIFIIGIVGIIGITSAGVATFVVRRFDKPTERSWLLFITVLLLIPCLFYVAIFSEQINESLESIGREKKEYEIQTLY